MTVTATQKPNRHKVISALKLRTLWLDYTISKDQAAARAGMSSRHMQDLAVKAGLPRRPIHCPPKVIVDQREFRMMWAAGVSTKDIAEAFGCYRKTVLREAHRMGLPPRHPGFTGTCTLDQYQATRLRLSMAAAARVEQAAIINAEMADRTVNNVVVGSRHVRGVM